MDIGEEDFYIVEVPLYAAFTNHQYFKRSQALYY